MKNNNKLVIIFSGYNQRAIISFMRTLEKNAISYTIIARSAHDPILKTCYKRHVSVIRTSEDLDPATIVNYIEDIKQTFKATQYLLAPSTEALNRLLVHERDRFSNLGVEVPLVNETLYCAVSDKKSFSQLCKNKGILIPDEYSSISKARLPFVAKPVQYQAQDGKISPPVLISSDEEKQAFIDSYDVNHFYYQKLVSGKSFYLLYYFHRNGQVYKFSQENLIQQPEGKSMIACRAANIHTQSESSQYEQLFHELNFFGLVMIEIISNETGHYMIEANPRFWGPSQLFVDADMNFFEALLHDYHMIKKAPVFSTDKKQQLYFWYDGVKETLSQNKILTRYDKENNNIIEHLDKWLEHDVYNRNDTAEIFNEETQ